jgi:hypothetical protein
MEGFGKSGSLSFLAASPYTRARSWNVVELASSQTKNLLATDEHR